MLPAQTCHNCGSKLFSSSFIAFSSVRGCGGEKGSRNATKIKMKSKSKSKLKEEEEEEEVSHTSLAKLSLYLRDPLKRKETQAEPEKQSKREHCASLCYFQKWNTF